MGETLDAGRDAEIWHKLVTGSRFRGMEWNAFIFHIHIVCACRCIVQMVYSEFLFVSLQLFLFLQDFSQRMLSKTHEIEKQLDGLIRDTKATDSRLHTVFNDFLMLSNTQFIENVCVFSQF